MSVITLIGAFPVVSTLMGPNTKLRIRNRYSKPCNLFTVSLSEPGAGKSQAYKICVESPLRDLQLPVVVHDITRKGLFQHLVAHKGVIIFIYKKKKEDMEGFTLSIQDLKKMEISKSPKKSPSGLTCAIISKSGVKEIKNSKMIS